jgi:acyl-CoA synthetase (AMP-forming)/AMP-acid ligase II
MPTIAGTLRATAAAFRDAEALQFGDHEYTYGELDHAVDRAAAALQSVGVRKGDRVALMATNSDTFVVAFYAVLRLGAVFVPVNPALAPPEVGHLVGDSGAEVLLFDPAVLATVTAARDAGAVPGVRAFVSLRPLAGWSDLPALQEAAGPFAEPEVREEDDALLLYTSGTTGKAKGALFDHHRAVWVAVNCMATCGMRVGDRFLHVAPLYHAAELGVMLLPGTLIGAKHVILSGFDPVVVADTLAAERITMFFGVPTMFQFLLRVPDLADRDLSAWRTGLFGAAPMPPAAVEALVAALPHVEFMQLCGQTEAGPGGIYLTADQVRRRPDASGRQPLPLTEVRVVDPAGAEVVAGEVGEIVLRGETVMKGYWNDPEATAGTIRDGWLHTGDLALVDADGYITVVDRLKDMIITGGRNVYSVEVESVVAAHPAVQDAAVVSRPHPDYGESVVAVVTPKEGAEVSLADVREFCTGKLAGYKIPHDLVVAPIPRNASGKVLKHELRRAVTR